MTAPERVPDDQQGLGPHFWFVTTLMTAINLVVAYAIVFGGAMGWVLPSAGNPASNSAIDIDGLFKFMSVFGSAIPFTSAVMCVFRYRLPPAAGRDAATIGVQIHDAPSLEFWWTIVPTLLLAVLVYLSIAVWYQRAVSGRTRRRSPCEVVAHQFNFEYRYPGAADLDLLAANSCTSRSASKCAILVSSADVLHSFWVPEFRAKAGAVPGLVQELNFTPTRTGEFDIVCAEFCGINHSLMQGRVVVESPEAIRALAATARS